MSLLLFKFCSFCQCKIHSANESADEQYHCELSCMNIEIFVTDIVVSHFNVAQKKRKICFTTALPPDRDSFASANE